METAFLFVPIDKNHEDMKQNYATLIIALMFASVTNAFAQGGMYDDFLHPTDLHRPWIIWQWMDGLVNKEAITKELEAFKEAGLSGVQNFQIGGDQQIRVGDATCAIGSEKWKQMMRWAMDECERLGLSFGTHNCPGWSSSAYPDVDPEYSMQKVVISETAFTAGQKALGIARAEVDAKYHFYRDICLLALPKDSLVSKQHIIDLTAYLPEMEKGRWADTLVVTRKLLTALPAEVRKKIADGSWTLMRFGHTTTGKTNEAQAAASGRGLECDKLSRKAVKRFWDGYPMMLINLAGHHAGKMFCRLEIDSYEAGGQDWSEVLPDEFMQRKGYDVKLWLPYIVGKRMIDSQEASKRFKDDFVDVLTSLVAENYYGYMEQLAAQSAPGMQLLIEPYATGGQRPFRMLDIHKILKQTPHSLVATEFWVKPDWGWKDMRGHEKVMRTLQKPLLIAEAFTCWPLFAWQDSPQSLKPICDLAFCTGVNKMMLHAGACNPWLNVEPGMSFGIWGTQFVPGQTWWKAGGAKALFDYMARCQSLLQRGVPALQQLPSMNVMKSYWRIDGRTDIIFICNPTDTPATETIDVKRLAKGRCAEIWNPYNLEVSILSASDSLLSIEGCGSRFLILTDEARGTGKDNPLSALRTDHAGKETILQLDDEWDIAFPNMARLEKRRLFDWAQSDNHDIKYFSGTATYTRRLTLSPKHLKPQSVILDLGDVKNMAAVRVNGTRFPVLWKAPFLLDIKSALREGDNVIEVDVTNLWPNRMIGDEQEPDDIEWSEPLIFEYAPGKPVAGRYMNAIPDWLRQGTARPSTRRKTVGCFKFFTKDSPLLPSGLMGPVVIR